MDQETVIFQQRVSSKGDMQFRAKFGRQKAFVFCQKGGYFYVDLYDNRFGKADRIGLGLNEIDALIKLRPNLESLKQCFYEQTNVQEVRKQTRPPTPPAGFSYQLKISTIPSANSTHAVGRQPLQIMQSNKRPIEDVDNHGNPDLVKKSMLVYEDVSPVTRQDNENVFPEDLNEYLFTPLLQD